MIVILNAPAGAGKDTIASLLSSYGYEPKSFKDPMFNILKSLSGLSDSEFFMNYNDRDIKEAPQDIFNGLSYREVMIKISEEWVKPWLGKEFFGDVASRSCDKCSNYVFSDGGFIDEVEKLHNDGHEVVVLRIRREGYTFDGDSRDYVYPEFCRSEDIYLEEGNPDVAVMSIRNYLGV